MSKSIMLVFHSKFSHSIVKVNFNFEFFVSRNKAARRESAVRGIGKGSEESVEESVMEAMAVSGKRLDNELSGEAQCD